MIGNLYDTLYQLAYSIPLIDYEVWVFAKNGKLLCMANRMRYIML